MEVRRELNGNAVRPTEEVCALFGYDCTKRKSPCSPPPPPRCGTRYARRTMITQRRAVARQRERFAAHTTDDIVCLTLWVSESEQTLSSGTAANAEAALQLNSARTRSRSIQVMQVLSREHPESPDRSRAITSL